MITKHGIRVESYVHRADGSLVNFDELQGEERVRAATELKKRYLNALFAGQAVFEEETSPALRATSP